MQPTTPAQIQHELVIAKKELESARTLAGKEVTKVEAQFALVVEAYQQEIDDEVARLARRYTDFDSVSAVFRINSLNSSISCLSQKISKLVKKKEQLTRDISTFPQSEDLISLEEQLEKLKRSNSALTDRITVLDYTCSEIRKKIVLLNPGVPSVEVVQSLFCPITRKPLYQALSLPDGTLVNADSLGLKVENGKVELKDTPKETYDRWERESLWSLCGFEEFRLKVSLEDFKKHLPKYLSKTRPDYKTQEVAIDLVEDGSTSDSFGRKPFNFQSLIDAATDDIYENPQLVECGHTQSQMFVMNTKECGNCRGEINALECRPHQLLVTIINEYQRVSEEEILRKKKAYLDLKIKKNLFHKDATEDAVRASHKEVTLRLIEIKHQRSFVCCGDLDRTRNAIRELEGKLELHASNLDKLKKEKGEVEEKIVLLKSLLKRAIRHKKDVESCDTVKSDLKAAQSRITSLKKELTHLQNQYAINNDLSSRMRLLNAEREQFYTERFREIFNQKIKDSQVSSDDIERMQYKLKAERKLAVLTAERRCSSLTTQFKLSRQQYYG